MKKHSKKAIALLLSTLMLFSACQSKPQEPPKAEAPTTQSADASKTAEKPAENKPTGQKVKIEFWTMQLSPTFDTYLNGAIEKFETENPDIDVNWTDVPWGDMETKITTAASSKTMPDVANLNPQFAQKLAQFGALADMETLASDVKADYIDGAWVASSYEGKTFGLPWYLTTGITYYNKDLFAQAGLDPEKPPTNFDDIYDICKVIKEKTGKYGYAPMLFGSFLLEEYEKAGIPLFKDNYTIAQFNSPEVIEFTEFYRKMLDEDLIPTQVINSKFGDVVQLYSSGEVAMFQGGTSHASMIETNNPEVYKNTGAGKQLIGNDGGKVNIAVMNIVISEASKNKEAATKFAKFITNADNQIEFAKVSGAIIPSTKASLSDEFFKTGDTAKDKARTVSAEQIESGVVIFPPIKNWTEVSKAFVDAITRIHADKADIKTSLDEAQTQAEGLLK